MGYSRFGYNKPMGAIEGVFLTIIILFMAWVWYMLFLW